MSKEFPNNSGMALTRGRREEPPEEDVNDIREPKKVISGTAKKHKKSLGQKISETFVHGDIQDVATHLVQDILIPSAIETVAEMGHNLVDGMIYADDAPARKRSKSSRNRERTSIDRGTGRSSRRDQERRLHNRRTLNFDDIFLETRGEAEMVLDELQERIVAYDQATVADLYDAVGWDHDYTESKYGWTDLSGARIIRVRGDGGFGYSIALPKAEQLD